MRKATDTVVESYPAYDIVEREATHCYYKQNDEVIGINAINVRTGEKLYVNRRSHTLSSVASYALEYNECPIQAYQKAVDNGHNLYWASQDCSSLVSGPRAKGVDRIKVEKGTRIYFEGRLFEIEYANNGNISLKEVEPTAE